MKRLTAILLALLMSCSVFLLTACQQEGEKASPPSDTGDSTKTTDKKTKESSKIEEDGRITVHPSGVYPVVDEPITITAMMSLPVEITDLVDNEFTKYLEEKTNVHLDLLVTPSEGYGDKLRLALNTGDYPEVIMSGAAGNNSDVVRYGIEEKIYIPLNPYIEEYAANLSERFEELPELRDNMTAPDGNIYALQSSNGEVGHGAVGYKAWINTQWLDNLGLEMPTTTEEFREVLRAFKEQDPNGNGIADEIPLSGAYGTWAGEPYLFLLNAFTYYHGLLKLEGEEFLSVVDQEEIREGLLYIRELYEDGLLDPAALTQDLSQFGQLGAMNPPQMGVFTCGHIGMALDITDMEVSQQYDYLLPLEGPDGYRGIPASTKLSGQGGTFAITDRCEYPEAMMRVIDHRFEYEDAMSSRFGPKGEAWDDADPGTKGVSGEDAIWKQLPGMDVQGASNPVNTYWHGSTTYMLPKDWKKYAQFEGDIREPGNYEGRLLVVTDEYLKYPADGEQIMPMWTDLTTSEELGNTSTLLSDYVKSSFVEFITGNKDIRLDKDWEEYLQGLEKLGYSEYIQKYSDAYFQK